MDSHLIIVEQANRHLINLLLQMRRAFGHSAPRLAFWGHGANLQGDPTSMKERIKRFMRDKVDFWFCYTDEISKSLAEIPESRKISVDNAIDTLTLQAALDRIAPQIEKDPNHLLFIGSMRPDKRFDLLFPALNQIFESTPKVSAAFVGDGPMAPLVRDFCLLHPDRATWYGPLVGTDAAPHLRRAGVIVIPGLIGLVSLDSFTAQAPILTTEFDGKHSPEFSYLADDVNAIVTKNTPEAYSQALQDLMRDPGRLERLRAGCRVSASRYTIENMAERFHEGIRRALELL